MALHTRVMNIQEFLYAVALGDRDQDGSAPAVTRLGSTKSRSTDNNRGRGLAGADTDRLPLTGAGLAAEVERHSDRTMTVVSLSGIETITRCGICPKEDTRPCMALRILALPYAEHPGYRSEWSITRPDTAAATAQDRPCVEDETAVLPFPRLAELPPPGDARRRILHQLGIGLSQSDFTDEELAQRGIAVATDAGLPPNNL
jgi:hypothetical protein